MTEYLYKPYTNKQYADFVVANKGRKLCKDSEKVWFEDYPQPTIEEQNEAIRQTRESLYRATSDYLKADYDEAVARGANNVEELKKAWLAAKDAVRAAHPYVKESSSDDLQPDQAENQTTTDAEEDESESESESDEAEPAATNTLPEQDISSWTGV